jgi:hypothetical protein
VFGRCSFTRKRLSIHGRILSSFRCSLRCWKSMISPHQTAPPMRVAPARAMMGTTIIRVMMPGEGCCGPGLRSTGWSLTLMRQATRFHPFPSMGGGSAGKS